MDIKVKHKQFLVFSCILHMHQNQHDNNGKEACVTDGYMSYY